MRTAIVALTAALLLAGFAGEASAQDDGRPAVQPQPLPGFGPTSIAIPLGWKGTQSGTTGPRLTRSAPPPVVGGSARYQIVDDAWAPKGPIEKRDEWLLAQPKMTLPAVSPDTVPYREWQVGFHIDRGNDFGWNQVGPALMPTDRRFFIDGEHQTTELNVRYGLYPRLAVGVRIPIHWRGVGFMDGAIDWFHELTEPLGFLDNGRPSFRNEEYIVEGRDDAFNPISWNDKRGVGMGNVELQAYWNVVQPCCRTDWRATFVGRLTLPTGSDPYDSGGWDVGLQFVAAKQLAPRWDVYLGVGGTWFSDTSLDGIEYESVRGHGFLALEYAVDARHSLLVEVNAASRLVKNLALYPALSSYINVGLKAQWTPRLQFEIGFTENLEDQQGTIDFGGFAGLKLRL